MNISKMQFRILTYAIGRKDQWLCMWGLGRGSGPSLRAAVKNRLLEAQGISGNRGNDSYRITSLGCEAWYEYKANLQGE